MNKINRDSSLALYRGEFFNGGNRRVENGTYVLHRTKIAWLEDCDCSLCICPEGWTTPTTLGAINAILETFGFRNRYHMVRGELHLDGRRLSAEDTVKFDRGARDEEDVA